MMHWWSYDWSHFSHDKMFNCFAASAQKQMQIICLLLFPMNSLCHYHLVGVLDVNAEFVRQAC